MGVQGRSTCVTMRLADIDPEALAVWAGLDAGRDACVRCREVVMLSPASLANNARIRAGGGAIEVVCYTCLRPGELQWGTVMLAARNAPGSAAGDAGPGAAAAAELSSAVQRTKGGRYHELRRARCGGHICKECARVIERGELHRVCVQFPARSGDDDRPWRFRECLTHHLSAADGDQQLHLDWLEALV